MLTNVVHLLNDDRDLNIDIDFKLPQGIYTNKHHTHFMIVHI